MKLTIEALLLARAAKRLTHLVRRNYNRKLAYEAELVNRRAAKAIAEDGFAIRAGHHFALAEAIATME